MKVLRGVGYQWKHCPPQRVMRRFTGAWREDVSTRHGSGALIRCVWRMPSNSARKKAVRVRVDSRCTSRKSKKKRKGSEKKIVGQVCVGKEGCHSAQWENLHRVYFYSV